MTPRLQNAIDTAYAAFGWRRLERPLEVCYCSCCMTTEMADSILATPLRDLSNEQLSEYTNSAHAWSDQFLYLLPRYMELIAHGQRPTNLDPDHILSRFRYAPQNPMKAAEADALDECLLALFEDTLCRPIPSAELDCALAQQGGTWWKGFGMDICEVIEIALPAPFETARLRDLWAACDTREADLRLASTLAFGTGAQHFHHSRFLSKEMQEESALWHDWFVMTDHSERMSSAFEREEDPRARELILAAL